MPTVIFWVALVFLLVAYLSYSRIVYPEFEPWPISWIYWICETVYEYWKHWRRKP